jgi:hypothetical protein
MKGLNRMKCSEAECNGVIERMSEGVASACALLSGCLAKKRCSQPTIFLQGFRKQIGKTLLFGNYIFLLQKNVTHFGTQTDQ